MFSLENRKIITIFSMVTTIVVSALLIITFIALCEKKEMLDFACSANITHVDEVSGMTMNANAYFIFRADGKGIVTLDGEIVDGLNTYNISRTINLEYEYFGREVYLIKERKSSVNTKDTIPSNLFEEKFFSSRYFHISNIAGLKNSSLISSSLLPLSVCVFN